MISITVPVGHGSVSILKQKFTATRTREDLILLLVRDQIFIKIIYPSLPLFLVRFIHKLHPTWKTSKIVYHLFLRCDSLEGNTKRNERFSIVIWNPRIIQRFRFEKLEGQKFFKLFKNRCLEQTFEFGFRSPPLNGHLLGHSLLSRGQQYSTSQYSGLLVS